ncbi:MAG: hypothetical protein Rsou_1085 [Candidatus Ruthia sp. Asou_11_S2]|nr:hypothetical protein [Candidatus Ruthia sp. Asou_11_S2]
MDGDNNEPLPKQKDGKYYRKYIASMTNLGKEKDKATGISKNFIKREINKDTVMGVLNRLIGDQRKLYQSRGKDKSKNYYEDYYFADIEDKVSFSDKPQITQEMTYLRNISGSTDQNSFTGAIKSNDAMFNSDYSQEFWGVLVLNINELINFIISDELPTKEMSLNPIFVINKLEFLNKEKALVKNENLKKALKKDEVVVISLYASALYLQLDRLSKKYNMNDAKTKTSGISGISERGFTKKDFMDRFTTGEKKKIWGNPYIHEAFVKGEGKTRNLMTKASGVLDIVIDISKGRAGTIRSMIYDVGVSSFYLGKKAWLLYMEKLALRRL